MTEFLDLTDLFAIAEAAIDGEVLVREVGLLDSALARPRASYGGQDAYPDLHVKAAALLHSLCLNHALVDGNKRLAWAACRVFLGINGHWVNATEDERYNLVMEVATGELSDVEKVAERLRAWCHTET